MSNCPEGFSDGISMESIISGPGEVIELISKAENGCVIGHKISYVYSVGDHGSCVQMGQYFCQTEGDFLSVHFEAEAVDGQVYVEIHSELGNTPIDVHDFLYSQFSVGHDLSEKGGRRVCDDGRLRRSFRFATKRINCNGRIAHEVVSDIVVALDALFNKYGAYLSYLDDYYCGSFKTRWFRWVQSVGGARGSPPIAFMILLCRRF